MKQRIISACVGLCVLVLVLAYFNTWVLNLAISVISVIAVWEVLDIAQRHRNRVLTVAALVFSVLLPFFRVGSVVRLLPIICFLFILTLLGVLLTKHEEMHVEQVAFMSFISLLVPFALTTVLFIRDSLGALLGFYYTVFALAAAWSADTGAYFAGLRFGKHKLSPKISPNKTVEGAIGGGIAALVCSLLLSYLFMVVATQLYGQAVTVNFWLVALASPVLTLLSIMGDLTASVIKRQYEVKDFGQIMPGHGGIMDRFDSVMLVMPAVYLLSLYCPLAVI